MSQRLLPFLAAVAVFVFDRITKDLIKTHLSLWDAWTVIPGLLNIVHTENPGIAFGMLANLANPWRNVILIGFSLLVLAIISAVLLRIAAQGQLLRMGLALVMGGALGNLFDRVVHGTVTDFVELHVGEHYFPAFNVADSAITVGACLLLLDMWYSKERKSQPAQIPREAPR
ncbi:MAG TPA: signal peptidase II [Bryobacteraceae bacterium]|nr:signal peptidase II [Bryobacteraceae bacterium]